MTADWRSKWMTPRFQNTRVLVSTSTRHRDKIITRFPFQPCISSTNQGLSCSLTTIPTTRNVLPRKRLWTIGLGIELSRKQRFQQFAQSLSCTVQAGLDGSGCHVKQFGGLFRIELFDVAQHQHDAIVIGKFFDASTNPRLGFVTLHLLRGRARPSAHRLQVMA